ncbi:MAG TPA: HEAT repeat domain-containing protein [Polyangiaceae bacterium]|nr:HEAT repeat domain-containing protein [Polyangiaceae bacterium]
MRRALLAELLLAGLLLQPGEALAQRRPQRPEPAAPQKQRSLKSELGLEAAKRLLRSDDTEERQRAFERLSAIKSEAALELLGRTLDSGGAARDGRERLVAVRALAPHARSPIARAALIRALSAPASMERADPLLSLARQTAALALARSADPPAQAALAQALRQPGRSAEAALGALSAYPPPDLRPVLRARGALTPALLELLEAIDDPRTQGLLHQIASKGTPELRARALVSLGKVQRATAAELARQIWSHERHPTLRLAAARTLALCGAPEAPSALDAVFQSDTDAAIAIALEAPSPALLPSLERALPGSSGERSEQLLAAIGRAGGPRAAAALERVLTGAGAAAFAAAYALALAPGDEARAALERSLSGTAMPRRLAVLAGALRAFVLRDEPSGLGAASDALVAATDPADRAAGAFALALLDRRRGAELVNVADPVVVRAAARAALAAGFAADAAERLARENDALTRAALAVSLADDSAADRVPNAVLEALLESGSVAAPLAARALAARDTETQRARVEQLLSSADRALRAHAAVGLSRSKLPSAVGLLEAAYRFETDAGVRRAIVVALSQRPEPGRMRTLELAAGFDPDAATRHGARLALSSAKLGPNQPGSGTLWVRLDRPSGGAELGVMALSGPGAAVPGLPDPSGFVVMAGLPRGPLELWLAPAAGRGQERTP